MNIFIEISIILIITTGIATIMRLLRQPLVVGYLISGVIVGPYVLGIFHAHNEVELFSKVGISILLFIVGLSLNPDTIKETGKPSFVTGIGQIVVTSIIGFSIMKMLGFSNIASMYSAIALTFSSTIIVLKLLSDRGDLNSLYGKISIGFLLVQDVIATLFLVIIPLIGASNMTGGSIGAEFFRLFVSGSVISVGLYLIAKYILPKFSDYLAKSSELLFLFSVSWGLVLATVFYKIGFSIEIGALVAGVTLSASKYSFEISSRMRPLRDFFIVMFFVLLGSQLVIANIGVLLVPAIILSLYVLIGNPIIVYTLLNLMGYTSKTAFMAGLTVAQISEFSLILMSLGLSLGQVDQSTVTLITLVGIVTIAGSTYLVMYADKLFSIVHPVLEVLSPRKNTGTDKQFGEHVVDVIIFGFGRVGLEFIEKAKEKNMSYLAVDYNPEVFKSKRAEGVHYAFGDVEDVEFLEEINTCEAKMIISTIPDFYTNLHITKHYRHVNTHGVVLVTCHSVHEAKQLYDAGATYVILPHYLGAYHATEMIAQFDKHPRIFTKARKVQEEQIAKHILHS